MVDMVSKSTNAANFDVNNLLRSVLVPGVVQFEACPMQKRDDS